MAMLPAFVKHRKQHTRGFRTDHVATKGNTLAFGEGGGRPGREPVVAELHLHGVAVQPERCRDGGDQPRRREQRPRHRPAGATHRGGGAG